MDHKNSMAAIKLGMANIEKGVEILSRGPMEYYIKQCDEYVEALFGRFCPWQKGTRVRLSKTPVITPEESWGWMGAKHFLIKGAKGTVDEVDYYDDKFRISVIFDNETHKDQSGKLHGVSKKHSYLFSESYLELVS